MHGEALGGENGRVRPGMDLGGGPVDGVWWMGGGVIVLVEVGGGFFLPGEGGRSWDDPTNNSDAANVKVTVEGGSPRGIGDVGDVDGGDDVRVEGGDEADLFLEGGKESVP